MIYIKESTPLAVDYSEMTVDYSEMAVDYSEITVIGLSLKWRQLSICFLIDHDSRLHVPV